MVELSLIFTFWRDLPCLQLVQLSLFLKFSRFPKIRLPIVDHDFIEFGESVWWEDSIFFASGEFFPLSFKSASLHLSVCSLFQDVGVCILISVACPPYLSLFLFPFAFCSTFTNLFLMSLTQFSAKPIVFLIANNGLIISALGFILPSISFLNFPSPFLCYS